MSTATAVHAVDATTAACLPCLYAHRSAVACSSNGSPNACNHVLSVTTCDVTAPLEKGVHFSLPEKEPPLSTSGVLSAILANLRLSSLLLLCGGAPTFNLWVCCPPFSQLETFNFHLLLCSGPPPLSIFGRAVRHSANMRHSTLISCCAADPPYFNPLLLVCNVRPVVQAHNSSGTLHLQPFRAMLSQEAAEFHFPFILPHSCGGRRESFSPFAPEMAHA